MIHIQCMEIFAAILLLIIGELIQAESKVLCHFLCRYHSIYQYLLLILLCMKLSHCPDYCNENKILKTHHILYLSQ